MKYLIVAALFGTAFAALAASPGDDDADRAWGKFAWENGDFSHANTLLTRYRTKAGVKQDAEADYMIATSWCRLPGLREKGSALLLWLT